MTVAAISRTYKMPVGGKWLVFTDADLMRLNETGNGTHAEALRAAYDEYDRNRLAYFLAHGVAWSNRKRVYGNGAVVIPPSEYPATYGNDGVAFLNDHEHQICMVVASSKTGKSYTGAAWIALRCLPCDPKWPIFTEHGVNFHPWPGPRLVRLFSFSWTNVADLWKRYREVLPRQELGPYAPNWGRNPDEKGRPRSLSFGDGKPKTVELACGTTLDLNCYTQPEAVTEGYESDYAHFDEQPDLPTWNGWFRGITQRGLDVQCCFTLTGRVLEDRPDTGGGGWVRRELWDGGSQAHGMSVARYHLSVDSVPDALIPPQTKKRLYDRWANPAIKRTEKDRRAGIARYWGGWEPSGGLVLPEWDREFHLIDRFAIPPNWTRYRMVDPGETTAALWIAVNEKGDGFAYREYYERGLSIGEHVAGIVRASGNTLHQLTEEVDAQGIAWPIREEHFDAEDYDGSVMDCKTWGTKTGAGLTYGQQYRNFGLYVTKASGQHHDTLLPLVRQWLTVDPNRPHHVTGKRGAPRLYVFNDLAHFVSEIEGWTVEVGPSGKEKPRDRDDHLMSCLRFWAALNPRFFGDYQRETRRDEDDEAEEPGPRLTCSRTGY